MQQEDREGRRWHRKQQQIGAWGEQYAARYLQEQGYEIIERNYRYGRSGEIDIVARDGDTLVFVEVKTRRSHRFGLPEEAVTLAKQNQLRKLAVAFLTEYGIEDAPCRFDVISIDIHEGQVQLRHLPDAF